jgi:hypothetical protein
MLSKPLVAIALSTLAAGGTVGIAFAAEPPSRPTTVASISTASDQGQVGENDQKDAHNSDQGRVGGGS